MKIEQGLFDHMVVQRNGRNVSEAAFAGTAANGSLAASVRKSGKTLAGFGDIPLGKVARGKFAACLKGLPVGGPYDIELRVRNDAGEIVDRKAVKDVLVGDVWIVAGQSNAQGVGLLKDGPKPHPLVRAWYMNDRWAVAKEPIHNMWQTVDQIHIDLNGGGRPDKNIDWGVGPGVTFGQAMHKLTGVPQGVLACAHGGTSMAQWDPKLKNLEGKSLYGATIRRFRKNGSKVTGIVWYQGCSDADPAAAPLYTQRMKDLVAAFRRDLGGKNLPVAMVQIATVIGWPDGTTWNVIQEQQRRLPHAIKNLAVVPAVDCALDDGIHISGRDQHRVGRRLAEAMVFLTQGPKAATPPIELTKVTMVPFRGCASIVVEFDNVVGTLRSGSRPAGFAVVGPSSARNVFDVELAGNKAIVRSTVIAECCSGMSLYYGHGTDPYCNITDSAGRSLPVFGPITIASDRAATAFIRTMRISGLLPSAGNLSGLKCPDLAKLPMRQTTFPGDFCEMHAAFAAAAAEDAHAIYACTFECGEPMKLALLLGYDGPVKAWLDRKEIYRDPEGTNPALPGDATVPFAAKKGAHELVIALGGNCGRAWGVFARLERLGVPKRLIRKGPEFCAMPKIIG